MKDKQFDHIIKNKLSGFVSQETPDWGLFLEKKTIADKADNTNAFDTNIKATLKQYHTSSPSQWSAFLEHKALVTAEEAAFDERIKAELGNYKTSSKPQWPAFKSFVAGYATSQINHDFDSKIRQELEGYEVNTKPDWQAFLDKKFDDGITSSLADYESDLKPQWDKFKKKRADEKIVADASFDESVAGQLGKQKVRYNSEHWLLLRDRLQHISYVRKQIFSYKALEMIFVSLILFTLGNHFYLYNTTPVAKTPIVLEETGSNSVNAPSTDYASTEATGTTAASNTPMLMAASELVVAQKSTKKFTPANNKELNPVGSVSQVRSNTIKSTGVPNIESNSNSSFIPSVGLDKFKQTVQAPTSHSVTDQLTRLSSTNNLGFLTYIREVAELVLPPYVDLEINQKTANNESWLHVVGAKDNHFITTPANMESGIDKWTQSAQSYSAELLFSRTLRSRLELESGIGYGSVDYEPIDEGVISYSGQRRKREVEFNQISLDFVYLPVNLKYHIITNENWSLFAGAGINNEFILRTGYDITDSSTNSIIPLHPGMKPEAKLPTLYKSEFTSGLLSTELPELPDFVDLKTKDNNFILQGTLSLGIERKISKHLATYLRSTYYHTLYNSEIGPYKDRLNKLNLGVGIKLRLH